MNGQAQQGPSTRTDVIDVDGARILCISDIRGALSELNTLAAKHGASAIIHSGDFGFYEASSLSSITPRTLKHLIQYSTLVPQSIREKSLSPAVSNDEIIRLLTTSSSGSPSAFALSEFPKLLTGELKLNVPVYTVWGACEDVSVIEKIRMAAPAPISTGAAQESKAAPPKGPSYSIPNLTVLDEATTRVLSVGGVRLRLFGLGGAVVPHKFFDNGTGQATIAGGQGTMWTTILQIGELVDTAQRVYDPTETRLLVSHASPGREGLVAQLAGTLKCDMTVSAGLHFKYGISWNEFSISSDIEQLRAKLETAKRKFKEIWDTVKEKVESDIEQVFSADSEARTVLILLLVHNSDGQRLLLNNALAVTNRVLPAPPLNAALAGANNPQVLAEDAMWRNTWNWNLPDVTFGSMVLTFEKGRVGSESVSYGFNFSNRTELAKPTAPSQASSAAVATNGPAGRQGAFGLAPSAKAGLANAASAAAAADPAPANAAPGAGSPGPAGRQGPPFHGRGQSFGPAGGAARGGAPPTGPRGAFNSGSRDFSSRGPPPAHTPGEARADRQPSGPRHGGRGGFSGASSGDFANGHSKRGPGGPRGAGSPVGTPTPGTPGTPVPADGKAPVAKTEGDAKASADSPKAGGEGAGGSSKPPRGPKGQHRAQTSGGTKGDDAAQASTTTTTTTTTDDASSPVDGAGRGRGGNRGRGGRGGGGGGRGGGDFAARGGGAGRGRGGKSGGDAPKAGGEGAAAASPAPAAAPAAASTPAA